MLREHSQILKRLLVFQIFFHETDTPTCVRSSSCLRRLRDPRLYQHVAEVHQQRALIRQLTIQTSCQPIGQLHLVLPNTTPSTGCPSSETIFGDPPLPQNLKTCCKVIRRAHHINQIFFGRKIWRLLPFVKLAVFSTKTCAPQHTRQQRN